MNTPQTLQAARIERLRSEIAAKQAAIDAVLVDIAALDTPIDFAVPSNQRKTNEYSSRISA